MTILFSDVSGASLCFVVFHIKFSVYSPPASSNKRFVKYKAINIFPFVVCEFQIKIFYQSVSTLHLRLHKRHRYEKFENVLHFVGHKTFYYGHRCCVKNCNSV